jgi:hypothetical protein
VSAFAIKGGIGDFLQCLPFVLEHPGNSYLVASHYDRATQFFQSLGIEISEFSYGRLVGTSLCPRRLFFDDPPFRRQSRIFGDRRPVVGVHLGGSDYSLSTELRFGFPPKALPGRVLDELVRGGPDYNFLVFGSPSELEALDAIVSRRVRYVREQDVTVSLSRVSECDVLVGSDSAFKTMSAMLRVPTVVWMGDYQDLHRDGNFVDPYVAAEVMEVFRYRHFSSAEIARGIEFTLDQIGSACSVSLT